MAAFDEVNNVVDAIRTGDKLDLGGDLAEADAGKPQTIMLIGSDKRAKGARDYADGGARSDTMILMRLDPAKKRDGAAVAAARPEGAHPRPRRRQAERRLRVRRRAPAR